jgi:hypothetical protein
MAQFSIKIDGLKEFQAALKRNPVKVATEVKTFIVRGIAKYNEGIIRNPWMMGSSGGGAPVDTGNLRDTHVRQIKAFEGRIYPTAPYASYVHGLDGKKRSKRGLQLRPWMDYVFNKKDKEIRDLQKTLLKNIVGDLAK